MEFCCLITKEMKFIIFNPGNKNFAFAGKIKT